MPLATQFKEEREELETVLRSGIFARSPSLAQFLQYVCGRYFDGQAEGLKEYNVATEALGRGADFDQKKDSIVRVEAHRLRKRLLAYYETEGAGHEIEITIPPGTYAPVFVRRPVSQPEPEAAEVRPPIHGTAWRLHAAAAVAVLALVTTAVVLAWTRQREEPRAAASAPAMAIPPGAEIRIMAGSPDQRYVDDGGNVWVADRFFTGGTVANVPLRPIARTNDPELYRYRREGEFRYDIPLEPGNYEMRLHFAETVFGDNNDAGGGESSRIFTVKANGATLLEQLDVVADAPGSNTAVIKVFSNIRPAEDGKLHLEFLRFKENPFVNGIELTPAPAGRMHPVRILPRPRGLTDSRGRVWSGDEYFQGGQLVERHENVAGTSEQELFRFERYGNFSYAIPVRQDGRYTLKLRFAEHWFGEGRTGGGGAGSRMFHVFCNGEALLRDFDVHAAAGGALRALEKTFAGLKPNPQGKLLLQFVPVKNYALINSIEVLEEAQPAR